MISLAIFTAILFLALWVWIAYEYRTAIPLSQEEELLLDEELAAPAYTNVQEAH